jgi:hypothetical protein
MVFELWQAQGDSVLHKFDQWDDEETWWGHAYDRHRHVRFPFVPGNEVTVGTSLIVPRGRAFRIKWELRFTVEITCKPVFHQKGCSLKSGCLGKHEVGMRNTVLDLRIQRQVWSKIMQLQKETSMPNRWWNVFKRLPAFWGNMPHFLSHGDLRIRINTWGCCVCILLV